jgi:SAM-dependent methyltransferase
MEAPPPLDDPDQYRTAKHLETRIDLHSRYGTARQPWFDWLYELLSLEKGMRVLDVGCGSGTLWRALRNRIPADLDVILTDLSLGMAATARSATGYPGIVTDARALSFSTDSFDVVIANHMLYHVSQPSRAIAEMRRVLRPDGTLIAATNGAGHMLELDELAGGYPIILSFSLENGANLLRASFGTVTRHMYRDELHITDADAAIDYVCSYRRLDESRLAAARRHILATIAERGHFRVSKASGAFVASG